MVKPFVKNWVKLLSLAPVLYVFQKAFFVGLYSRVGGYKLEPRVSCLSDIGLDRCPMSERQETPYIHTAEYRDKNANIYTNMYIQKYKYKYR